MRFLKKVSAFLAVGAMCLSLNGLTPVFAVEEDVDINDDTIEVVSGDATKNEAEDDLTITEDETLLNEETEEITEAETDVDDNTQDTLSNETTNNVIETPTVLSNDEIIDITLMFVLHDDMSGSWGLEDAKIVYKTFSINKDAEGSREFYQKIFESCPDGYTYTIQVGMAGGYVGNFTEIQDNLYYIDAVKSDAVIGTPSSGEFISIDISFIDVDTNELLYSTIVSVDALEKPAELKPNQFYDTDIIGYDWVQESYPIDYQQMTNYTTGYTTVYVKKVADDFTYIINFYVNENGMTKKVSDATINFVETDLNGDHYLEISEIKKFIPVGYSLYTGYSDDHKLNYNIPLYIGGIESPSFMSKDIFVIQDNADEDVSFVGPSFDESELDTSVGITITPEIEDMLMDSCNDELKTKIEEALASGKKVSFVIDFATDKVDDADRNAVSKYMEENNVHFMQYFDLSIVVKDSDGNILGQVTETKEPLNFSFKIADNLKQEGREFYLYRVHDGVVTQLELNGDLNLSFSSDKFSTYAIGYVESKNSGSVENPDVDSNSQSNINKNDSQLNGENTKKESSSKSEGTNTSTNTNLVATTIVMGISLFGVVLILRKKA